MSYVFNNSNYSFHKRGSMNRRGFLKTSAIAGIGFQFLHLRTLLTVQCEAYAKSNLVVATGPNPTKITRAAIEAAR